MKIPPIVWIGVILVFLSIVMECMMPVLTAEYSAELAVEQMQIEGSMEYTAYHTLVQNLELAKAILNTTAWIYMAALIGYVIYISISTDRKWRKRK